MVQPQENKNLKGFALLVSVLIVGAVSLAIVVSTSLLGVGNYQISASKTKSVKARNFVDACIFESLERLRQNHTYIGTINLAFTGGTCSATISGSLPNINIVASGQYDNSTHYENVVVTQVSPKILLNSWQEISN